MDPYDTNTSKREIKFRVWCEEDKHYYYSPNAHFSIGLNGYVVNFQNAMQGEDYILEQYTGLKDSTGKEIYEGDLYKWRNKTGHIIWKRVAFYCIDQDKSDWLLSSMVDNEYKIIGNIHENPELLEG